MHLMQSPPGARVIVDGREVLYFAGTGYFGLQGDPRVIEAGRAAFSTYGVHPATSRTGYGETLLLRDVETKAARFLGAEDALYLTSGYASMSVLAQAAAGPVDLVLADQWLHGAGLEAAFLTQAPIVRFRHGDPEDLAAQLRMAGPKRRTLVLCDAVSPVLGDVAPISAYLDAVARHPSARLMADDAHGVGVLGAGGRGTAELAAEADGRDIAVNESAEIGPDRQVWIAATLSKALGGAGGVIAGSRSFIEKLKRDARWYHGAAACASPVAAATATALDICLSDGADMRKTLTANAQRLRSGLRALGLPCPDWPTPIVSVAIGDGANMMRIRNGLLGDGFAIAHVRNYSGVGDEGALRIAAFSTHTAEMIDALLDALRRRL